MLKRKFECKRDSLTICGYQYRETEGVLPAVILCHGFLANQSMCTSYANLLAKAGYVTFTFDFNGGGLLSQSSGKSVDMTVKTEVEDLKCVIDYVKSLADVDDQHIFLLGCSQGGVVSAIVAKQKEYRPAGLILLYPALCIPDDARKGKMMFARFDPDNIPDILQNVPMKLGGDYARCVIHWSLKDMVGDYDGPVLLLHGTADRIVPIRYAREAVKAYSKIEYYEIVDGQHMFRGKQDQQAQNYIVSFFKKRNK